MLHGMGREKITSSALKHKGFCFFGCAAFKNLELTAASTGSSPVTNMNCLVLV